MREPKYQAWHKQNKKMYRVAILFLSGPHMAMLQSGDMLFSCPLDDIELRQFTGLYNQSGNEIYEGDIIKTGQAKEKRIARPFVGRIYWFDHEFQWWVTDDTKDSVDGIDYDVTLLRSYQDVEIIGNIYEHPELMKDHNA